MRTDRDQRSDKEIEIDDFLSKFDNPLDDFNTDINSYLDEDVSAKATAARTFHGAPSQTTQRVVSKEATASSVSASSPGNGSGGDDGGNRPPKGNKKDKKKLSKEDKKALKEEKARKRKEATKDSSIFKRLIAALFLVPNEKYDPSKGSTYIKNGKKIKNKPLRVSFLKIVRDIFVLGCACVLAFMIYAFVIISMAPRVNASDIYATIEQSSVLLDDKGNEVDTIYYTQNRTLVKYADCPEDLVNAFVAIEDKTFWKHHGFNWIRMIGAVVKSVFGGGSISGTSTITQQLARNVYLADTKSVRSIKRKVLEMYYTTQIERCLTKEEIIEAYMNCIYLGFGCYGVDAASRAYFSKEVKDLTLVECAALAALPQAPEAYALIKYPDSESLEDTTANIIMRDPETLLANDVSKDRRSLTLYLMKDQGYITDEQYEANKDTDLISFIKPTIVSHTNNYSYFREYVIDEVIEDLVKKYKYSYEDAEKLVYTGGLKINSTIDSQAQAVIVSEFADEDNFPSLSYLNTNSSGHVLSDYGDIILYKYDNYFSSNGNFVLAPEEFVANSDGSVTIKRGKRLNIYTTEYGGNVDYSLEFKATYIKDNGTLYSIPGGYINIPRDYKKLDKNDDLVISAEYFQENNGAIVLQDGALIITPNAYSLQQKVIQPQAAMVIADVKTGQIKAMVGGRKQTGQRLYNRALYPRQPGSSIKPLAVYGAALQKSYELEKEGKTYSYTKFGYDKQNTQGYGSYLTASSVIVDEPMTVNGRSWPKNAGGGYSGTQTFRTALQQSLNTCAVKIQLQVGVDYGMDTLKKFGITTTVSAKDSDTNDENTAALALGGMSRGTTPLEMAEAYTVFPNGGKRHTATAYTTVTDRKGKVLLEAKSKEYEVLDEGVAWIMTDLLKSVVTNGIASSAYVKNVQSGGKTGTTNDQYDIWFDGFTPTYAGSLWIGTDNNIAMASMSGPAAALWGRIMRQIDAACTGSYRDRPSNVINVGGEWYTSGTEKGKSTYIDDEKKKKEEEEAKKKAEEEAQRIAQLIADIDTYMDENGCSLQDACEHYGVTVEYYKSNGGTREEPSPDPPDPSGGGGTTP